MFVIYRTQTDPRTHREKNIEFFRYKFLFLLLLVFYPQISMQTMRMRQFIIFFFFCYLGGLPPLEGSYHNKISKCSIMYYVLPAHKISLQSDNFYFLASNLGGRVQPLGGLELKNKQRHSSCRKNYIRINLENFLEALLCSGTHRTQTDPQTDPRTHRQTNI